MRYPMTGFYIPLSQIPDPVFALGSMGPGFGIEPTDGRLLAPFDGRIRMVHDHWHALVIEAMDQTIHGVSLLIHIGIDSVKLNKKGFNCFVQEGDFVKAGQLLIEFDLDYLTLHIPQLTTPVICLEGKGVPSVGPNGNFYLAGSIWQSDQSEKLVAHLNLTEPESGEGKKFKFEVTSSVGLHARPAAEWTQHLKNLPGSVWIKKSDDERVKANSVLNLLSLGLKLGDQFCVEIVGIDLFVASPNISDDQSIGEREQSEWYKYLSPILKWAKPIDEKSNLELGGLVSIKPKSDDSNITPAPQTLLWVCSQSALAPIKKMEHGLSQEQALDILANLKEGQSVSAFQSTHKLLVEQIAHEMAQTSSNTEKEILQSHLEIIEDADLYQKAVSFLSDSRASAPFLQWWEELEKKRQLLCAMSDNPYLQERAFDIQDIQHRFLQLISKNQTGELIDKEFIAVTSWITPSLFMKWRRMGMVGLITEQGGETSHVAILAKSMSVAYVSQAGQDLQSKMKEQEWLWMDGDKQELIFNPSVEQKQLFFDKKEQFEVQLALQKQYAQQGIVKTQDHQLFRVYANISHPDEANLVDNWGGDGVGLVRSEFLFMDREQPPTLEEQIDSYYSLFSRMGANQEQIIIRTFDVGGDKNVPYLKLDKEDNPFLGQRGARLYHRHSHLFLTQLKAIDHAYEKYKLQGGTVKLGVMLPMLSQLQEWELLMQLDLPKLEYGVMMEVPSALIRSDVWAQKVSFMSIGSNDLSQYTLAMDRGLASLSSQSDGLDPAVLQLMYQCAQAGLKHKCPVGICGGLAGDILALPLLVGMQLHEISVSLPQIPKLKLIIAQLNTLKCQKLLLEALQLESAMQVRQLVKNFYQQNHIKFELCPEEV